MRGKKLSFTPIQEYPRELANWQVQKTGREHATWQESVEVELSTRVGLFVARRGSGVPAEDLWEIVLNVHEEL